MRPTKLCAAICAVVILAGLLLGASKAPFQPLPAPVSSNAVAALKTHGRLMLFSFMGIGAKKTWDAVTNSAYALDTDTGKWIPIRPVPGTVGRTGAVAVPARESVFLFGGYVLDPQGGQVTVPDANVYEPTTDRWYRPDDVPVRVADAVAGVFRDRYIYLIGGWSRTDAVREVQMYDAEKNIWKQATPLTGPAVFGHAGAIVGDTIVYVDGTRRNPSPGSPPLVASDECWMGKINRGDPTKIQWTKLPNHPGSARFRIAAGGSEKDNRVYFTGGTESLYNYNGVGLDGKPAQPSPVTFAYNLKTSQWELMTDKTANPSMDQRGLLITSRGLVLLGGMDKDQNVLKQVAILPRQAKAE